MFEKIKSVLRLFRTEKKIKRWRLEYPCACTGAVGVGYFDCEAKTKREVFEKWRIAIPNGGGYTCSSNLNYWCFRGDIYELKGDKND